MLATCLPPQRATGVKMPHRRVREWQIWSKLINYVVVGGVALQHFVLLVFTM
jgi:hypothetical protein